jgi:hypothetical protein
MYKETLSDLLRCGWVNTKSTITRRLELLVNMEMFLVEKSLDRNYSANLSSGNWTPFFQCFSFLVMLLLKEKSEIPILINA